MEPHQRTELIHTLAEEAPQKIGVLEKAAAAHDVSQEESQRTAQGTPNPQAPEGVQNERRWWAEVFQKLTEIRQRLEQIEHSERQRGVSTEVW
jgi:hypothetical protein